LLYENITRNCDVAEAEKGMKEKSEEFIEGGKEIYS
jgi:phosphomethylpyrimidine synthase